MAPWTTTNQPPPIVSHPYISTVQAISNFTCIHCTDRTIKHKQEGPRSSASTMLGCFIPQFIYWACCSPKKIICLQGRCTKSNKICSWLGISEETRIKDLSIEIRNKIVSYIENNIETGDDLRQTLTQVRDNQIKIKCYKGQRAKNKLPRRGQRTHTNSKTSKKLP